jgi:RNA polymerase subunit RPABC4/transcription elongation factor Spt4
VIRSDYLACPNCRRALRAACPTCDRVLEPAWKVCPYCGQDPKAKRVPPPTEEPAGAAEA